MTNLQSQRSRSKNPMSEYLLKLQIIVSNTEFKDKEEANKYETANSKLAGDAYCRAMTETDIFESYQYDQRDVYKLLLDNGYSDERAWELIKNYAFIPQRLQKQLMEYQRNLLIAKYDEPNPYYVMLTGKPFKGSERYPADPIILIPDEFYNAYAAEGRLVPGMPVHEMPKKYQDLLMNTEYYTKLLEKYPNQRYLRYIGSNAIPIHIARKTKDGEIMKINTNRLTASHGIYGSVTVEPDIIHLFTNVYTETRKYVYDTLRGDFSDIYPNYNSFIRFLTIYMAIGGCLNEMMKKSASMIYMNQSTANDFFMLYGLPSVIMEGPSMISFLKQFRLILMDKGTNIVYRVKDLVGYEYTDIYTLVMVKQQVFDKKGLPVYVNGVPQRNIVFRRLGTTDDNTSYFKYRDSEKTYTLDEITSGDPRWWNTKEVEQMLYDMNYTLSNSKYIQLSTHMSMTDIYWQSVILLRGLLDNRFETQFINMNVNVNLDGRSQISVFEAILILEILMNWQINTVRTDDPNLHGDIYLPNGYYNGVPACLDLLFNGLKYYDPYLYPDVVKKNKEGESYPEDGEPNPLVTGLPYKVSAFNFRVRELDKEFYQQLSDMDYLEPDVFIPMLDEILDREENNIGEVMMSSVKHLYDYLEIKLRNTKTIHEFRQVTDAFNHLFLVNPERPEWYDEGEINVDEFLMGTYHVSMYELSSLKSTFTPEPGTNKNTSVYVTWNGLTYDVSIYDVMNEDVYDLSINGVYPFRDTNFMNEFKSAIRSYRPNWFATTSLTANVKALYQDIIIDKVLLDTGNNTSGPKSFEALLFRNDPSLYRYIISLKGNGNNILLVIRAIVKALEQYTQSSLQGLEFTAIGEDNYFNILKEVIGYFKSYMVEYSKDEFVYIFDGLFDQGGNSNMLRLYDENTNVQIQMIPRDSLTLHDASCANVEERISDKGLTNMYDEMIVQRRAAYINVVNLGYPIVYDDGTKITQYPDQKPDDNDRVVFSIYENGKKPDGSAAYQVCIVLNKK